MAWTSLYFFFKSQFNLVNTRRDFRYLTDQCHLSSSQNIPEQVSENKLRMYR